MKRVQLDSSTVVAAIYVSHPKHSRAFAWLERIKDGEFQGVLSAHSLAEVFSILSGMPVHPPMTPHWVRQTIKTDILPFFEIVELSAEDYLEVIERNTQFNLRGGIIYDALIVYAGRKANVDLIVTLNLRHFHMVAPEFAANIVEP